MTHSPTKSATARTGSPRIDGLRPSRVHPSNQTQRISRSAAMALYEQELAYYRADAPYLTVEKAAERCVKLSLLLTQAELL